MVLHNEGLFTLQTNRTTYQMKVDEWGVLLHLYYGPRLEGDMSYLIRRTDRGFSPALPEAGRDRSYSLDTLPQEFPCADSGDYRIPALELELPDGGTSTHLRVAGWEIRQGKQPLEGLPAFREGEGVRSLGITLEDRSTGVEVELTYSVYEELDLITRSARVTNRGRGPLKLRRCGSVCLDLQEENLDFISFDGSHTLERVPCRTPVRPGVQSVGSVRGTSSHQHNPFVMLCSRDAGETGGLCWGVMLLYSGNFQAAVEGGQYGSIRLVMGIHPWHFCWTLEPGESFQTPEAAMICSDQGFGAMSRSFHRAIRTRLLRDPWAGTRRPVVLNSWEAAYFDFNLESLLSLAREGARLGAELFVLDDGWFGSRKDDTGGLGDWKVNEAKLPGGLKALSASLKEMGMELGLWVEPEMVSEDSELYREHPDWILNCPDRPFSRGRDQLVLDFTRPEVRERIFRDIGACLEGTDIHYLKWDMNRSLSEVWSASLPAERQGEVYHRYVLGLYDLLERFRQAWPDLLIEGCSGGGGRFDAGMLYYTPQIWCSDNTDAGDRLVIQCGTSFAYPTCTMGSHVSETPNAQNGRLTPMETRGTVALAGAFGYEMDLRRLTPEDREEIRRQIEEYKRLWALPALGDYYRLSDAFAPGPYTAWAHVAPDRREALVCVVSGTVRAASPFRVLKLQGLDPLLRYRVNGGETYTGAQLMQGGYPLPLFRGDWQALRLHLKAEP